MEAEEVVEDNNSMNSNWLMVHLIELSSRDAR